MIIPSGAAQAAASATPPVEVGHAGPDAPARYLSRLRAASAVAGGAARIVEQSLQVGRRSLAAVDDGRLAGAVRQADEGLAQIAAAERYRLRRQLDVPAGTVEHAMQSVRELQAGTHAVRRALALVADPKADSKPHVRDAALSSMGIGASRFRMAQWLLETAADERARPGAAAPRD